MEPSRELRIIVGDALPVTRNGLSNVLDAADGLRVVGMAASGAETLALARVLRPDVVVADADAADLPAFEMIRRLRVGNGGTPPSAVIVLSAGADASTVFSCLSAGAMGFLLKDAEPDEIVAAARSVASGEAVLEHSIAGIILDWFFHRRRLPDCAWPSPVSALSDRECEVLQLLAQGLTDREMAAELGIGSATVRTHTHRLRRKLNLSKRTQLMLFAHQAGIALSPRLPLPSPTDLSPD